MNLSARVKKEGWDVTWKDSRKNLTFTDAAGNKVQDTNLSKTFQASISKAMFEGKAICH